MDITDEQIRAACRVYDLDPVGHVPVTGYEVDLDPDNKEDWDGDACWELASQVVDGEIWPDAGPLGFAAGHRSPGWKFLRDLCDQVASDDIGSDWFAALSYDGARDHMRERAEDRARLETWPQALVCVADLGVNTITEEAKAYLTGEPSLDTMAWDLLSYAGYLVLREVFAPQIDSKQKD
jgi:hypothetical protein